MTKVKLPKEVADHLTNMLDRLDSEERTQNDWVMYMFCNSTPSKVEPWVRTKGNLVELSKAIEFGYEVIVPAIPGHEAVKQMTSGRSYSYFKFGCSDLIYRANDISDRLEVYRPHGNYWDKTGNSLNWFMRNEAIETTNPEVF